MVAKLITTREHYNALQQVFKVLKRHQLKLNPEKYSFRVQAEKFLGFVLIERGIKANPEKPIKGYNQCTITPILTRPIPDRLVHQASPAKAKLARRMVGWIVQLSEFDISFERTSHIKAQALADFMIELALVDQGNNNGKEWFIYVDRALNQRGSGAGVILESPDKVLIEQSLHFKFKAKNNQVEYKALLAGMKLAGELRAQILMVKSDFKLVIIQVNKDYQERKPQLIIYWDKVTKLATSFEKFTLLHIP
ncbi:hypothetical protein CR513_05079, partial [Mucuna pruriens]